MQSIEFMQHMNFEVFKVFLCPFKLAEVYTSALYMIPSISEGDQHNTAVSHL